MQEHFLVTGAQGCIGAWVVKNLIEAETPVTVLDLDTNPRRLQQIASEAQIARVTFIRGDVADAQAVADLVSEHSITRIIHLAGLQTPACQADPIKGAQVNVIGALSVFEAVRQNRRRVQRIVYASSAAVFGQEDAYTNAVGDDSPLTPISHYGVFKQANEGSARVYWREHQVSSIGLRPLTIYGPGRDQGMTSAPTKAMKAAVVHREFTIPFSGKTDMLYVDDCAKAFIRCALVPFQGAKVYNLSGALADMREVVEHIESLVPSARGRLRISGGPIPIYPFIDGSRLQTLIGDPIRASLRDGIVQTVRLFGELRAAGRLDTSELD